MNDKLLLAKSITLLFRESQLKQKTENSSDLIRTVLESIKIVDDSSTLNINSDKEIIIRLKSTVLEMCGYPPDHEYDKSDLIQTIKNNCMYDTNLFEVIQSGVLDEIADSQLKRSIVNYRKTINNYFRERKISEVLSKYSMDFKYKRDSIKDINGYIAELIGQLEPLQLNTNSKDPAVIGEVDLGSDESLREIFTAIKQNNEGTRVYKTGWQDLNDMLQGGIRPSEFIITPALQHKYKTGFNLSLFAQIARLNLPHNQDPNRKPLLLRISFEDELVNNLQFLYQYLKYNETREYVSMKSLGVNEMSAYVKQELQKTGFHVKMMRVDPTQWTYRHICNKIIEFEAQGYVTEGLFLDYLAMVPTVGCITTGAMGTDMRDLIRRMRNFCSTKGIFLVTPHQLSPDAKNLIRGGVPEDQFVKEIAEKGYTAGSKQLDQEVDLEIYIHLVKHNRETYLTVQRGKHRLPTVINDDLKYFILKFPKGMPIPEDINELEHISIRKIKSVNSNTDESLFK
jgi:hypothetical protein